MNFFIIILNSQFYELFIYEKNLIALIIKKNSDSLVEYFCIFVQIYNNKIKIIKFSY